MTCPHNRECPANVPGCDRCEQEWRERVQMERNARVNQSTAAIDSLAGYAFAFVEVKV